MHWERMIMLIDMNAFFASIEQLDHPELQGKPVAVTNGDQGTCIITASYEARAYGIKTGMRLREGRQLCPSLIICPSHPQRYTAISSRIMTALQCITPDIEVFSVDEAFLDLTHCQRLWGTPEKMAMQVQQLVKDVSGLPCSIGISGDKTTAKFAAKQQKPMGITIIHPDKAAACLAPMPVTELCGIGPGIGRFLAEHGVIVCGDMQHLPISVLGKRFGHLGRRIWYMCQGCDPEPLITHVDGPKSIGHGKVMPPNTRNLELIKIYLKHMSEKVAARLRRHDLEAQTFFIGFRRQCDRAWFGGKLQALHATQHGQTIYTTGLKVLLTEWQGEGVCQLQVTALNPQATHAQPDLFETSEAHAEDDMMDLINQRFGAYTLIPASLLARTQMHDVIAPAWRPIGTRRSV